MMLWLRLSMRTNTNSTIMFHYYTSYTYSVILVYLVIFIFYIDYTLKSEKYFDFYIIHGETISKYIVPNHFDKNAAKHFVKLYKIGVKKTNARGQSRVGQEQLLLLIASCLIVFIV